MASVTIGDYIYTTSDTGKLTASVEAEDKSKSSYGPIQSSVEINGVSYSVTSLHYCFDACFSLTQAPEIPSSVTKMSFCFANCAALTAAPEIPSSVTDMASCFNACTSLTQAPAIPSSVTNMGSCFQGCESLTQAPEIPSSVTNMHQCFYGCTNLTQAPIFQTPSSVTDMGYCFYGCASLTQAPVIPSSVTNMERCFRNCTSLTQAPEIPSSVTNMNGCFLGCSNLAQAPEIPSSVTDMVACFWGCTSFTQAPVIPSGVTNMMQCFQNCTGLTQAPEIPSSVTNMNSCFYGCSNLAQAPEIPSSVTNIGFCFYICSNLTQAPEIPSSVTNMRYCFHGCTSLTGTVIVHNVPTTYDSLFNSNANLEIITIGTTDAVYNKWSEITNSYSDVIINDFLDTSVTFNDGDYAYTSSIESETIDNYHQNEDGDDSQAELEWDVAENGEIILCYHASGDSTDHTVTFINNGTTQTIGPVTFDGGLTFIAEEGYTIQWLEYDAINVNVYKLSAKVLDKTKEVYSALGENFYINNVVYNLVSLNNCFHDCTSLTQAPEIPSSVTNMGACFYKCSSLTQAPEIPSSVTYMNLCFAFCTALTVAPEIPSSVTSMVNCFVSCASLTQAPDIPSSVTNMESCFSDCTSLTQAPVISSNVTSLNHCFNGCTALTQAPEIPSSVASIGSCFENCTSLTQAPEIPSGVTYMRWCFAFCTALTVAPEIPSSVTDIGYCFDGCTSLTQAPEIPSSVTAMNQCFMDCTSLTGVVKIATSTSQNFNAFFNTTKPIYLINNTSPKDAAITANLRALAATQSNVYFEADNLTPPSTLLRVARVDDDEETVSTIDGLWAYLNALTTVYGTGLPEGWSTRVNGGVLYADSIDVTSSSHMVGPTLDSGNRYLTNSWYHVNDLSQHSMNFGIKLDIYDETGYVYTNVYPGNAVILSSSIPLVSYLAGGGGLAIGQACIEDGFFCALDPHFADYSHIMRSLFDLFYPKYSYYETSLPATIPSGESEPTTADLNALGDTWFDPNYVWGGTWILETEGQVHISAGANYAIAGALTDTSDGGSADAIVPYHNHSVNAVTTTGMSAHSTHSHTISGKYKKTVAKGSNQNRVDSDGTSSTSAPYSASSADLSHTHGVPAHNTNYAGEEGNVVGANMQPYIVVNRWHRIA